jgi:probable F420-dependent oxidoreductase
MDFGVGYFPTHDGMTPGEIARMVEERGQESWFLAEHTHIPASRESPWPGGGELPPKYWRCYDLFVALTAAAAATNRLRVASGICLIIERDPITTAKEVASVDHLSGGRMEFGVGAGWNLEEMRNHGTDPTMRWKVMRERVEAMKAIWTEHEASYHGDHVDFEAIWSEPKPAQRPHPPVLVGGTGPRVLERVLAFGDGWIPNYDDRVLDRMAELDSKATRAISTHIFMPADPAALAKVEAAGARRAIHWLPSGGRSIVEAELERWEDAIAQLTGG